MSPKWLPSIQVSYLGKKPVFASPHSSSHSIIHMNTMLAIAQRKYLLRIKLLALPIASVWICNIIRKKSNLLRLAILLPCLSPWQRLWDNADLELFLLMTGVTMNVFVFLLTHYTHKVTWRHLLLKESDHDLWCLMQNSDRSCFLLGALWIFSICVSFLAQLFHFVLQFFINFWTLSLENSEIISFQTKRWWNNFQERYRHVNPLLMLWLVSWTVYFCIVNAHQRWWNQMT